MNTFKRKSLYAALAGVSALGVTGAAEAVYVNPDGLGQVLIYPYYTVRETNGNAYNTLLSVVNSTGSVKGVKVRFMEGKNSRETLDFNLYLSPYDVWTAAIIPTAEGAAVKTSDTSCTTPAQLPAAGQPFVNYAYSGFNPTTGVPAWDGSPQDLDRGREGYFEIIEMGVITHATAAAWATHTNSYARGTMAPFVPLATSVGFNCTAIQAADNTVAGMGQYMVAPTGGLFGGETVVNVFEGTDYTADPVALDAFSNIVLWNNPGTIFPNLANVTPKVSTTFGNVGGAPMLVQTAWSLIWNLPADPVSAVLMHDAIVNEYVVDGSANNAAYGTDWVVTFPTKWNYYEPALGVYFSNMVDAEIPVLGLFQRNYSDGACDNVSIRMWDREERSPVAQGGFSPPAPGEVTPRLCWEANVITFNNSNVLASVNSRNVAAPIPNYATPEGWMRLGFPLVAYSSASAPAGTIATYGTAHRLVGGATTYIAAGSAAASTADFATYYGLPSIGFAVNRFTYNNMPTATGTVLANFGGNFIHKGSKSITFGVVAPVP